MMDNSLVLLAIVAMLLIAAKLTVMRYRMNRQVNKALPVVTSTAVKSPMWKPAKPEVNLKASEIWKPVKQVMSYVAAESQLRLDGYQHPRNDYGKREKRSVCHRTEKLRLKAAM